MDRVPTSLLSDATSTPAGQALKASLDSLRSTVGALAVGAVVSPQNFGAVANSPAAAAANRAALQSWFDAGSNAILFQDPNDVFHVNTGPETLKITKRVKIPSLRLRPVVQAAGQGLIEVVPAFGAPLTFANAAVTRGQTTFTLAAASAVPTVGQIGVIRAGLSAYAAVAGWRQRVRVVAVDASNPLAPTITVDTPAPRALGAFAGSFTPITSDPSGSHLLAVNIDLTGQANACSLPFRLTACRDTRVNRIYLLQPNGGTVLFGEASEGNVIHQLASRTHADNRVENGCRMTAQYDHDNYVGQIITEAHRSTPVLLRNGYSSGLRISRIEHHKYGVDDWFGALLQHAEASDETDVTSVHCIDEIDPANASTTVGFKLSSSVTDAKLPKIASLYHNKDVASFGCLPLYVQTKSLEGPLSVMDRQFDVPALAANGVSDQYLLKGVTGQVKFFAADFAGFDAMLFRQVFSINGATDFLKYRYNQAYVAGNESPVGSWFEWLPPNAASFPHVGFGQSHNYLVNSQELWLRFAAGAAPVAAGKSIRLQIAYYPTAKLFVSANG